MAIVAAPVATSSAQPTPGDAGTRAASLEQFERGKKAYEAGDFEAALLAFSASLELQPSPNTRLYVARCYRALGKTGTAYVHFRLASREAQDRLATTGEKRYSATRDAAATEGAELESKVPRLTVTVPSDAPWGLVVKVDGIELPKAAWGSAVEMDPGGHRVEASGGRFAPFSVTIALEPGDQARLPVELKRLPTASLSLHFASRPAGLAVELDDRPIDATDAIQQIDVGAHRVLVHAPGYTEFVWAKSLADGEKVRISVTLRPEKSLSSRGTPRWLFFGAAGAGVVALGVGSVFGLEASHAATIETNKDPLERDPEAREDVRGKATRANVLFAVGGVLAVGAAVLAYFTDWPSSKPSRAGATPVPARAWLGATRFAISDGARSGGLSGSF